MPILIHPTYFPSISHFVVMAQADRIVLEVEGVFIQQTNNVKKINLQFNPISNDGLYVDKAEPSARYSRDDLIKLATSGKFIGTFTAHHGVNSDLYKHPQPAIWSLGPIQEQRGKQSFPTISSSQKSMLISARHIKADNNIFVDGLKTSGKVNQLDGEKINVALDNLPPTGIHLLQLQESEGRFSNEFIFYVK